jgi:predicted  nucleic acid-binding Zn-ribbon protein
MVCKTWSTRPALQSGLAMLLALQAGCVLVPKTQLDESQKVAQVLRTENARLKDQVSVLTSENRDASDRAIDDAQRLATQDQAITRLETSVQAYQDDRERLASAVQEIKSNLELPSRSPTAKAVTRKSTKVRETASSEPVGWTDAQVIDKSQDAHVQP